MYSCSESICCTNEASSWHTGVQDTGIQATATLNLISTRAINDAAGIHHYLIETYYSPVNVQESPYAAERQGKHFRKMSYIPHPQIHMIIQVQPNKTCCLWTIKINTKSITVVRDHLPLNNTVVCTESKVTNQSAILEWFIQHYHKLSLTTAEDKFIVLVISTNSL